MRRTPHPIGYQHLRVEVTWTMRRSHPHPHQPSTLGKVNLIVTWNVKSWSDMSNEEKDLHPIGIRSWEWSDMSSEEEDPHPHSLSGVESWSDMSSEEEDPHTHAHWSLGVESWSDMNNEEEDPTPLVMRNLELKWHEQWGGGPPPTHWSSGVERWSDIRKEEDPHCPPLIGHQELRVEVTWAVRRRTPPLATPVELI